MGQLYSKVMKFQKSHFGSIAWRIRKHCEIVEKHLNPGEEVLFAFAGQKNDFWYSIFNTYVVALTNKRLVLGRKRLVWGYFFSSVTPDLYNDLLVYQGLIWGKVTVDTVKEVIVITNLSKSSLDPIETNITEFMMKEKRKYGKKETEKN